MTIARIGKDEFISRAAAADRWYCLSREGQATLCRDEADARKTAAGSDVLYHRGAPHRAVRLVEATDPPAEWAA